MPEYQQIHRSKKPDTTFQKQATSTSPTHVSNPFSIIQRAKINSKSLTHADIMQLQRTIGNRAVGRLLSGIGSSSTVQQAPAQRQEIPEEEEPLQGKFENKSEMVCPSCFAAPIVQKQEIPEEEEPLQGKFETIQCQEISEEEEPLQGKFERVTGRVPLLRKVALTTTVNGVTVNDNPSLEHEADVMGAKAAQFVPAAEKDEPLQGKFGEEVAQKAEKAANNTGLPDNLKTGIENLSRISMDGVKVHYNSGTPAQLNALAYAQGNDIHVGPGQERYLPHEAWHVVQQKQGRVKPTMQMNYVVPVDHDKGLEREADTLRLQATQFRIGPHAANLGSSGTLALENQFGKAWETGMATDWRVRESPQVAVNWDAANGSPGSAVEGLNSQAATVQCAWIGARPLAAPLLSSRAVTDERGRDLNGEYTPKQHVHIFFEDGLQPANVGFHSGGTFQETDGDLLAQYKNLGGGYEDGTMRQATSIFRDVANSTAYSAFGTNCQWYVDQVIRIYGSLPEGNEAPFGERTGLLSGTENRRKYF